MKISAFEAAVVVALLGFLLGAGTLAIRQQSVTVDERAHLPAGVSYWQRLDARMNLEHPPLLKALAALPVVIRSARADYSDPTWRQHDQWGFGEKFFSTWNRDAVSLLFSGRLMMLALVGLTALAAYRMGRALGGPAGGMLSLALVAASPFFLAYGPLVLTDVASAMFAVATAWALASLWRQPTVARSLAFGGLLALAWLSKFATGLLLPAFAILLTMWTWRARRSGARVADPWRATAAGLLVACAVVYLAYAALFWNSPAGELVGYRMAHSTKPIPMVADTAAFLTQHPALDRAASPALLFSFGVGSTLRNAARPTWLLGHYYPAGTWQYFPVLFALKMTPVFLALCLALLGLWAFRARRGERTLLPECGLHVEALLVTAATFAAAAISSSINIGIRHFAVPVLTLAILNSLVPRMLKDVAPRLSSRALHAIVGFLIALQLGGAIAAYPDYISYFNFFTAGTPKYQIAIDSNLDMGQTMPAIAAFAREHKLEAIGVDTYGTLPELYVPQAKPWRCDGPQQERPEWVAIGATRLLSDQEGSAKDPAQGCLWLFQHPHWELAGGAAFAFHLPGPSGPGP